VSPLLVLANGAGLPSASPWMSAWAERLRELGPVVTFDYPYQRAGRSFPDRLPKLVAAHREAVAAARAEHPDRPLVLVGKSMGGRVGCHVSLEEHDVTALVCLGYPLVGQGGAIRDEVLLALRVPVLFVQGTRDEMCPLDHLAEVRGRMKAPTELHVVEGGDHSLLVPAAEARVRSQEAHDRAACTSVASFLARVGSGMLVPVAPESP
jgi:hypothetical protein